MTVAPDQLIIHFSQFSPRRTIRAWSDRRISRDPLNGAGDTMIKSFDRPPSFPTSKSLISKKVWWRCCFTLNVALRRLSTPGWLLPFRTPRSHENAEYGSLDSTASLPISAYIFQYAMRLATVSNRRTRYSRLKGRWTRSMSSALGCPV